jgi:hypothetical protein
VEPGELGAILLKVCQDDVQGPAQAEIEAIEEALKRLKLFDEHHALRWTFVSKARAERECVRGCEIRKGDAYAWYSLGASNRIDLCLRCLSLALFLMGVQYLPDTNKLMHEAFARMFSGEPGDAK